LGVCWRKKNDPQGEGEVMNKISSETLVLWATSIWLIACIIIVVFFHNKPRV